MFGIKSKLFLAISTSLLITAVQADQTIINNYPAANAPAQNQQPTNNCNNNTTTSGLRPGTYNVPRGDGNSDEVYTTGDKQPYNVDYNCNQQPAIQPYIYAQPGPPGPPGPRPTPPGPLK